MDPHEPDGTLHEYDPGQPLRFEVWLILMSGLIAITYASGCAHAAAPTQGLSVGGQRDASVMVTRVCPSDKPDTVLITTASGVVVAPETVLTANHVVRCPGQREPLALIVTERSGVGRPATIRWRRPADDLAGLRVAWVSAHVAYAAPRVGGAVCIEHAIPAYGRSCGVVTMTVPRLVSNGAPDITHTAPTEGGNSGAGLWDEHGFLVGIVTNYFGSIDGTPAWVGGLASSVFGRMP